MKIKPLLEYLSRRAAHDYASFTEEDVLREEVKLRNDLPGDSREEIIMRRKSPVTSLWRVDSSKHGGLGFIHAWGKRRAFTTFDGREQDHPYAVRVTLDSYLDGGEYSLVEALTPLEQAGIVSFCLEKRIDGLRGSDWEDVLRVTYPVYGGVIGAIDHVSTDYTKPLLYLNLTEAERSGFTVAKDRFLELHQDKEGFGLRESKTNFTPTGGDRASMVIHLSKNHFSHATGAPYRLPSGSLLPDLDSKDLLNPKGGVDIVWDAYSFFKGEHQGREGGSRA